jgi:hypothetical protein
MNKLRILFVLMIVFTLAACVPQGPRVQTLPGKRPAPPETARRPTDGSGAVRPDGPVAGREQADIAYLDERLSAYEEKYQKWQALAGQMGRGKQEIDGAGQGKQCLRYAGTVFDYYDRLREQATLPAGATGRFKKKAVDPWEASRADIAYLESDCDTVHEQIRERLAQRDRELSEPARKLEGVIAAYVENRQYNEALAAYRNLERRFPGWEPSLKTRHAYGLALLRTNQLDQAGQVLREVLPQLEPGEQPAVKLLLADLLWATHQFEEARDLYQSLAYQHASRKESENWVAQQLAVMEQVDRGSEEMAAYISLLQIYLAFDGRQPPPGLEDAVARIQARFPGSIISQRAQQILQATGNQATSWVNEQISAAA